jgi:putative ABC transport system permease protein
VNPSLLFRTIWARLWRYKAKTLAMGLGIMIAVLTTVVLLTIIGSVRARFLVFIGHAFPANSIVVMAGGGPMTQQSAGRKNLKLADVETIVGSTGISEWDPFLVAGTRDVKRGGNASRVGVWGYSDKAESVRGVSVREGEFLSAEDVRDRAHVALIGATTAAKLFPDESPIGAELFIDNVPFRVKGVLEAIGVDVHGNDQDDAIRVPYTTLMDHMLKVSYVSGVMLLFDDQSRVEPASQEITRLLRERHHIGAGQKDDFAVITSVLMHEIFEKAFRTFNIFIPLIAGTAFLISALVILSIMQISVKGRTEEIGLRKAMGARSRDLQTQIILEVLIIAVLASVIGILLAQLGLMAVAAPILEKKMAVKQGNPSLLVLAIAVGGALGTGLLGGVLPARRAAKLNPVEALK